MCGRYNLVTDAEGLADFFDLVNQIEWRPRYNIAPSQPILAIRPSPAGREGVLMRWGLIPFWAKDAKIGYHTINARAETVDQKPAYRAAFRRRRCLIPATGFYEWRQCGRGKQPYVIRVRGGGLFAFAGLWESWKDPDGGEIESCSIIVTDANEALKPIHDRMPVILDPEVYERWLDPDNEDHRALKGFLRPYPSDRLEMWPVSRRVGNPSFDDPGLIESVPDPSC